MKRPGLLALAAAVTLPAALTLAGCRAIVGIEDLSVESDSGAPSSADGATMDVATDSTIADSSRGDSMAMSDSPSSDSPSSDAPSSDGSLDAGTDATLDSAAMDSANPPDDSMMPPPDSEPPPRDSAPPSVDSGYTGQCLGPGVDGGCPSCCHSMYPAGSMDFTNNLFTAGCPCTAPGSCYLTACGSGAPCSMPPTSPSQTCGMCINALVAGAATDCPSAITACGSSSDPAACAGFYDCVSTCPGPPDGGM